MKKILFVIPTLSTGGTCSALTSICRHFKDKNSINVFSITDDKNYSGALKDFLVKKSLILNALEGNFNQLTLIEKIASVILKPLKRLAPHYIRNFIFRITAHTFSNKYNIIIGYEEGIATQFVSFCNAEKKIAWIHCDYSRHPLAGKELELYRTYNEIVCVSQHSANILKKIYPSISNSIRTIHNIVDVNLIKELSKSKIEDFSMKNNAFRLLSIGRLHKVKRFHEIPKIASQLKLANINFIWFIIGPGEGNSIYHKIHRLISIYNVGEQVVYLGNKINPYPYFVNSDLLVCTSESESCPMIFLEAKVLKLPVLTSDFPTASEFIEHEKDGFIVTIENMGEILKSLICDKYKLQKIRHELNEQYMSKDSICNSLDKLFNF